MGTKHGVEFSKMIRLFDSGNLMYWYAFLLCSLY
jgi:hypothetical protein